MWIPRWPKSAIIVNKAGSNIRLKVLKAVSSYDGNCKKLYCRKEITWSQSSLYLWNFIFIFIQTEILKRRSRDLCFKVFNDICTWCLFYGHVGNWRLLVCGKIILNSNFVQQLKTQFMYLHKCLNILFSSIYSLLGSEFANWAHGSEIFLQVFLGSKIAPKSFLAISFPFFNRTFWDAGFRGTFSPVAGRLFSWSVFSGTIASLGRFTRSKRTLPDSRIFSDLFCDLSTVDWNVNLMFQSKYLTFLRKALRRHQRSPDR